MTAKLPLVIALCLAFALPASAQSVDQQKMMEDFGLDGASAEEPAPQIEPQRLVYDGAPIQISLRVNAERRLIFDSAFEIGIDPQDADAFSPEVYDHNLLLTVSRPVSARLRVRLQDGQIVPLDILAVDAAVSQQPIQIVRQRVLDAEKALSQAGDKVPDSALHLNNSRTNPSYIDLVRFAAQSMYAPDRLIKQVKGAAVVPLEPKEVRLVRFDYVSTLPIRSWQMAGLYVTAIKVTNKQSAAVNLDPRLILGNWRAATFHHRRLQANGSGLDTTMLYLVSDRPFDQALGVYKLISEN